MRGRRAGNVGSRKRSTQPTATAFQDISAASNALAMASLLLPARTASPMAMTICLPSPNFRKRPAVFWEAGVLVVVGGEGGIGQPGRTGADDRDALAPRRLAVGIVRLSAGGAVHHAADARSPAHLVDACVAGETSPDRLSSPQFLDPLRIGNHRAAERAK